MNQEFDIAIFKLISEEMNVAEIYLGHIPFAFHFSKAAYTATCTEAFPFNPYDKVICELLKVEEQLSFENIGDILGMNVYESENPKRYLDLAEKEILTEALESLASPEFGKMIEGGDINFSRCKLTLTGREYAEKKSKFRVTANKPFVIYFDHTTGNHKQAKQRFEFVDGKPSGSQFQIEPNDALLKEIAAVQVPEIYNPAKQYSFTDAILKRQENLFKEYPVALTYNTRSNSLQLYCLDTDNRKIHKHFTDWLNLNQTVRQDLIEQFEAANTSDSTSLQNISSIYSDQIASIPETAKIGGAKPALLRKKIVDESLFYSSFEQLFNPAEKVELFLCLPTVTGSILKAIKSIIQSCENDESRFFLIFQNPLSDRLQAEFNQLKQLAEQESNLYVLQYPLDSFLMLSKTGSDSFQGGITRYLVSYFPKKFFQWEDWDIHADNLRNSLIEMFSEEYALPICEEAASIIDGEIQEQIGKDQLDELSFYEFKLEPFVNIGNQAETVAMTLELIENFKLDRIEKLEARLKTQLNEIENALAAITDEAELVELQKVLAAAIAEIIIPDSDVEKRSQEVKNLIAKRKEEFEEARKVYWFIIDTNSFLVDSGIIQKIQAKNKVVIAARVLDELDKHKGNPQHKEAASKAIREIFADKNKNIHRATAKLNLLPPDFNRKSPDNIILATALIYKNINGILISDDKGLHEKAKTVGMKVMTYNNFISTFVTSKK